MHLAWGSAPREPADRRPAPSSTSRTTRTCSATRTRRRSRCTCSRTTPRIVPTIGDVQPPLMFWYRTGDAMLDSVQATYLWQVTTVQQTPNPGMPMLTRRRPVPPAHARRAPPEYLAGFVVLMARTGAELDARPRDVARCRRLASTSARRRSSPTTTRRSTSSSCVVSPPAMSAADPIASSYDDAFRRAHESHGEIYGELSGFPEAAHFRRMELLAGLDLGDLTRCGRRRLRRRAVGLRHRDPCAARVPAGDRRRHLRGRAGDLTPGRARPG